MLGEISRIHWFLIENSKEADFYEDEELYEGLGLKNIQMGGSALSAADDEEDEDLSDTASGIALRSQLISIIATFQSNFCELQF